MKTIAPFEEQTTPLFPVRVSTQTYQATVITDLLQFQALSKEWNTLLIEADVENLNLRHEWLTGIIRHFPPARLLIITIWDSQGRLVGAAPLCITRGENRLFQRLLNIAQFIGTNVYIYDWMKIPIAQGEDEPGVLRVVADVLKAQRRHWDVLDLQFSTDRQQLEFLHGELGKPGQDHSLLESLESIPSVNLPETIAEFEGVRSKKKVNADARRYKRKVEGELGSPAYLEFPQPNEDTDRILDAFFARHIEYWTARTGKSGFKRFPQLTNFYKEMLRIGHATEEGPVLTFSILKSGELHLSYQLGIWLSNGYLDYINNYDRNYRQYGPGILHMDLLIRSTIQQGGHYFCFGRGDEPYKNLWAEDRQPVWSLTLFKNLWVWILWRSDFLLLKTIQNIKANMSTISHRPKC